MCAEWPQGGNVSCSIAHSSGQEAQHALATCCIGGVTYSVGDGAHEDMDGCCILFRSDFVTVFEQVIRTSSLS